MGRSDDDEEPRYNRKRSYSELKITGPPLYNQGEVSDPEAREPIGVISTSTVPLDAKRTALLIVDVQPEYWSECPAVRQDFPHFPSSMSSLIQHCREASTESIIWVRADYSYEKSPWLQQFSRLHKGRIPPVVEPSSKWESFAEPRKGETIMNKNSWSSTSNTELLNILRRDGIQTVLVCGLITSVCVQHSAFGVFEAGFRTILVTDCCADRGKARHDAALALYGGYMYELRTVASVKNELRKTNVQRDVRSCDQSGRRRLDKMDTLSESTGSLTSLDSSSTFDNDDEEVLREARPTRADDLQKEADIHVATPLEF